MVKNSSISRRNWLERLRTFRKSLLNHFASFAWIYGGLSGAFSPFVLVISVAGNPEGNLLTYRKIRTRLLRTEEIFSTFFLLLRQFSFIVHSWMKFPYLAPLFNCYIDFSSSVTSNEIYCGQSDCFRFGRFIRSIKRTFNLSTNQFLPVKDLIGIYDIIVIAII